MTVHVGGRSTTSVETNSIVESALSFLEEMVAPELLGLLALDGDPESVVLSRAERKELLRRFEQVEEELRRTREEFEQYKKCHPETVGVKFGKAYARKTPTEPRPSGASPGRDPGIFPASDLGRTTSTVGSTFR